MLLREVMMLNMGMMHAPLLSKCCPTKTTNPTYASSIATKPAESRSYTRDLIKNAIAIRSGLPAIDAFDARIPMKMASR